jgi:hypothetical protein
VKERALANTQESVYILTLIHGCITQVSLGKQKQFHIERQKPVHYTGLTHMNIEAEDSHNLLSMNCEPEKQVV